jgi:cell division FtsZ-interacting protein ZapD
MAIPRAQLLKDMLPDLNALFRKAYVVHRIEDRTDFMSLENLKIIQDIPIQTACEMWLAAFGDVINEAVFYQKLADNDFLMTLSQYLYQQKLLKLSADKARYYVVPFSETENHADN